MELRVLSSQPFPCGYFDDRLALYEHYLLESVSPEERNSLLACGYRAFGKYTFRPACHGCQACVPLRIPVQAFCLSKAQKRILKRGDSLSISIAPPHYTREKLEIYKDHSRRFPGKESTQGEEEFRLSFYEETVPTLEFCYRLEGKLIAVGIVHETPFALSSVYFTYRQSHSHLRLGTFSTLKEIEHAQHLGKRYLYLGYYIRDNHFMSYKKHFYPSEVLLGAAGWSAFRGPKGEYLKADELAFQPFPVITF